MILGKIFAQLRLMTKIALRKLGIHSQKVLVYVGLHRGESLNLIFLNYRTCYCFEANPDLFPDLQKRYGKFPHVKLFNVAVTNYDGEIEFNISNNDGASSSVGEFRRDFLSSQADQLSMVQKIKVPCINLYNFLRKEGILFIDDYISDIQGMDLTVLKSLKPLIDTGRIGSISCEVAKDEKMNIYNLPDNSETGFQSILHDNYVMVAKGWGLLTENGFAEVKANWWEMDCKWKLKPKITKKL